MNVITRFPPSPTGLFHIGSARTALFNYLFAAHNGGKMYLRFEDTDKERSKREFESDILAGLAWLKIPYEQQAVFRQSEKTDVYKKHVRTLIEKNLAYEAEGSTDDPSKKVIRFKNPNVKMTFTDIIRGEIAFDTTDLADFVIAKNVDEPLYHFAVVVDDHDMAVTHVIRGEDHISNTPRQILILEALGFERPAYGHIPLILAPDRTKMSKRHGAVSINQYREDGFLAEALVNYLAILGWNPGNNEELFSLEQLVGAFSLEHVQKSGAIFDLEKLRWYNKTYLSHMSEDTFASTARSLLKKYVEERGLTWDEQIGTKLLPLVRERIHLWRDIAVSVGEGEFDFFFFDPRPLAQELCSEGQGTEVAIRHLEHVRDTLANLTDEDFLHADKIKAAVWEYATKEGRAFVLWPMRFSLSGRKKSPDPFIIASLIGKEATVRRLNAAIKTLKIA